MHVPYYPMFVSLEERMCLVVGGGNVGERKIRKLLRCGASVQLVTQKMTPWLHEQCLEGKIILLGDTYEENQMEEADLVFATTNDEVLNRKIASDAQKRRVWCNMATDPEQGSFLVPSVVRQGPLTIAISTSGLSPALARQIREKLEKEFGPEWIPFLNLMGFLREAIQSRNLETLENQRIFKKLSELPLLECVQRKQRERAIQEIHPIVHPWLSLDELSHIWNRIWKTSFL